MTTIFDLNNDVLTTILSYTSRADLYCLLWTSRPVRKLVRQVVPAVGKSYSAGLVVTEEILFQSAKQASSPGVGDSQLVYLLRRYQSVITDPRAPVIQYICFYASKRLIYRLLEEVEFEPMYFFYARYYLLLAKRFDTEASISEHDTATLPSTVRDHSIHCLVECSGLLQLLRDGDLNQFITSSNDQYGAQVFIEARIPLYIALGHQKMSRLPPSVGPSGVLYGICKLVPRYGFSCEHMPFFSTLKDGHQNYALTDMVVKAFSVGAVEFLEAATIDPETLDPDWYLLFRHRCLKCVGMDKNSVRATLLPDWRILNEYRRYPLRTAMDMVKILQPTAEAFLRCLQLNRLALPSCQKMAELEALEIFKYYGLSLTDEVLDKLLHLHPLPTTGFIKSLMEDPEIPQHLTHKSIYVILRSEARFYKLMWPNLVKIYNKFLAESTNGEAITFDFSTSPYTLHIPTLPITEESGDGGDGSDDDVDDDSASRAASDESSDIDDTNDPDDPDDPDDPNDTSESGEESSSEENTLPVTVPMFHVRATVGGCRTLLRLWCLNRNDNFPFRVMVKKAESGPLAGLVEDLKDIGFPNWSYRDPDGNTLLLVNRSKQALIRTSRVNLGKDLSLLFQLLVSEGWDLKDVETIHLVPGQAPPSEYNGFALKEVNI